jgi:rare lipoprotein A (peptidoglycan hydrolase)
MKRIVIVLLVLAFPFSTFAAGTSVTRRDGFLEIWNSIRRPAEPFKTQFDDVPEPAKGSLEIDFAAGRGIIDIESDKFYPDLPLTMDDALVWLLRTRNVTDDPEEIHYDTLSDLLTRYPIAYIADESALQQKVTEEELLEMMRQLDTQLAEEDHEVSLYSEKFHGKGGAFGEQFDMYALTAAHRSFPYNTLVKVTNLNNNKSVVVRINDRGPYVEGRDMDLSLAAFTSIEDRSKGKFRATFQRLGDATLVGECGEDSPEQQRLSRDVILTRGVPWHLKLGNVMTLESEKSFVVRKVTYSDGNSTVMQDFINKGEHYEFKPSVEGQYTFKVGTIEGRMREMTMEVVGCD